MSSACAAGLNIFAGLGTPTPQVGKEAVLAKNPDTIIASGMDEARPDWLDEWKHWSFLKADTGTATCFSSTLTSSSAIRTRILLGSRQLCEVLEQAQQEYQLRPAPRLPCPDCCRVRPGNHPAVYNAAQVSPL